MIKEKTTMATYYQPEAECASREEMKALQDERLVAQVKHVWENVPYYRAKMEEKGITPDDIKGTSDLHKLPFLTKDDLRDAYPYGLLGTDLKNCVRIHSTSGTTGKRVVAFYTQADIDLWDDCCARAIVAAGGSNEDVCQVAYGYGLFTGGFGLNGGSQKVGCLTLPMSSGNTERQIQFMQDLRSTILCCTPSYAAYLAGKILLTDESVKDVKKAIRYFEIAAEQGNDYAQFQLGKLYLFGKEIPIDYDKAMEYLKASAENGNKYSENLQQSVSSNRNWSAGMGVFRLFHHLARIIQDRIEDERKGKMGAIDRKQRRQINEKKQAQGLKLE